MILYDYEVALRQINDNDTKLNGWESDFISSVNDFVDIQGIYKLSNKQEKKLKEIHERIFG